MKLKTNEFVEVKDSRIAVLGCINFNDWLALNRLLLLFNQFFLYVTLQYPWDHQGNIKKKWVNVTRRDFWWSTYNLHANHLPPPHTRIKFLKNFLQEFTKSYTNWKSIKTIEGILFHVYNTIVCRRLELPVIDNPLYDFPLFSEYPVFDNTLCDNFTSMK